MNELIENVIDKAIAFRWYQMLVLFLCAWIFVTANVNLHFLIIASEEPIIHCIGYNDTSANDLCLPHDLTLSNCSNLTKLHDFHSIAAEWDLLCDRLRMVHYISYAQLLGMIIGAPLVGQLADIYGRKWAIYIALLSTVIFGSLCAQSPTWTVFLLLRLFLGFFNGGLMITTYTFLLEYVSKKHRMWITGVIFTIGQASFVGIAWLTGTWWLLAIMGNVIALPLFLILLFIDESPRWLLQHGRLKSAGRLLGTRLLEFRIQSCCGYHYKISRVELKSILIHYAHEADHNKRDYTLCYQCPKNSLLRRVLILSFSWFSCSFVTAVTFTLADSISENIYLNTIIFVGFRLFAAAGILVLDILIKPCGRRVMHVCSTVIIIGACSTIGVIILLDKSEELYSIHSGLILLAFGMTGPWWFTLYVRTAEIAPTAVRASTMAVGFASARIAACAGPELTLWITDWPYMIFFAMAALSLLDLVMSSAVLPETKNLPLMTSPCRPRMDQDFDSFNRSPKITTERSNSFSLYVFSGTHGSRHDIRLNASSPTAFERTSLK